MLPAHRTPRVWGRGRESPSREKDSAMNEELSALRQQVQLLTKQVQEMFEVRNFRPQGLGIEIIPAERTSTPEAWDAMIKEWEENPLPDE